MITENDYNMDVETQRRIEYTRKKLMRIEQMNEQLRKLKKENRSSEERLERLSKRKESLKLDVARLDDASIKAEPEIGADLLHSIEEPLEVDMIYGEAFREKMCQLKVLLNDIIVRTSFNEKAMCKEIGHQEAEFENRLKEVISSRSSLSLKSDEAQKICEELLKKQANLYEDVQEMEENIEKFDASRWLLNVEKRRVSDLLDRTKREPPPGADCRKQYIVPAKEYLNEEMATSSASLSHTHFDPEQHVDKSSFSAANAAVSLENIQLFKHSNIVRHHKDTCPKSRKNAMNPIPHSDSLIFSTGEERQNAGKECRIHGKQTAKIPINGINLMDLISKAIEEELSFL